MELTGRLRSWALARPRVLLVDAPGSTAIRWSVEAELDRRGWSAAASPAQADLMIVLGEPGPQLVRAVDVVWSQIPEPRHRVDMRDGADVAVALDDSAQALLQRPSSPSPEGARPSPEDLLGGGGTDDDGDVAGLPMASTGPDRDGLELDVLTVSLGPVLPGWPTGLVLRGEVHGDVVMRAELSWLDTEPTSSAAVSADLEPAALDRLARILVVAGWPTAARDARRARDGFRSGRQAERDAARRLAEGVSRKVLRSRVLTRGMPDAALGRLRRWCAVASGRDRGPDTALSLDDVGALVEGCEIGTARLIVAASGIDGVSARGGVGSVRA